jgi:hypothetical protein
MQDEVWAWDMQHTQRAEPFILCINFVRIGYWDYDNGYRVKGWNSIKIRDFMLSLSLQSIRYPEFDPIPVGDSRLRLVHTSQAARKQVAWIPHAVNSEAYVHTRQVNWIPA